MKVLYHYTSIKTLKCILANQTLRLSDLTKSNDSAEIYTLKERIGSKSVKSCPDINNFLWLGLCFTELKDDLHMWSEYGKRGVSICFDVKKLYEWVDTIGSYRGAIDYNDTHNNLRKVSYRLNDENYYKNLTIDLFNDSAFVKGDYFKCECEWRLVIPFLKNYRPKNELILFGESFVDIKFPKDMICGLVLSPDCEISQNDIKALLVDNGYDFESIKIVNSIGTYRHL